MPCSRICRPEAQQLVTVTSLDWLAGLTPARVYRVAGGRID